jgi:hypothetical protein
MRMRGVRRGPGKGATMSEEKCSRCRCVEYIPTWQFVKFEDTPRYLCQACWELFKGWFFRGARAAANEEV